MQKWALPGVFVATFSPLLPPVSLPGGVDLLLGVRCDRFLRNFYVELDLAHLLLKILFSANHGMFSWTPVLILAVAGASLLVKRYCRTLLTFLAFYYFIASYPGGHFQLRKWLFLFL